MNQNGIAAVVLACCAGGAPAQSAVTIYGIADAAFVAERGGVAGNGNKIVGTAAAASRIGFRGTEDRYWPR